MVKVLMGDLLQSRAQTLVNTVNCVGVMGKGIALDFKERFPEMYKDYVARCERGEVRLGEPYLFRYLTGPWVLNFPTKDHWRSLANLNDIVRGLEFLLAHYQEWGITSLAVPPLGCGNGQLEWRVVGPTLYRYLQRMTIPVELFAPHGTPHEELRIEFLDHGSLARVPDARAIDMPEPQWVKPAWVALVEVVKRIEQQPYHWPIGRTIFQKIAYVATAQGLPTGLQFEKGSYGPFAPGLKRLEARLVGNGLVQEQRQGKTLRVSVGPTYEDAVESYRTELDAWDEVIDRTADLFMRVSTANQAELVSTVMFSAKALGTDEREPTERMVFDAVMGWKQRRQPPLAENEVAETIRTLAAQRWISVAPSDDLPLSDHAAY